MPPALADGSSPFRICGKQAAIGRSAPSSSHYLTREQREGVGRRRSLRSLKCAEKAGEGRRSAPSLTRMASQTARKSGEGWERGIGSRPEIESPGDVRARRRGFSRE